MIGTLTALQWLIYDSFKVCQGRDRPCHAQCPRGMKGDEQLLIVFKSKGVRRPPNYWSCSTRSEARWWCHRLKAPLRIANRHPNLKQELPGTPYSIDVRSMVFQGNSSTLSTIHRVLVAIRSAPFDAVPVSPPPPPPCVFHLSLPHSLRHINMHSKVSLVSHTLPHLMSLLTSHLNPGKAMLDWSYVEFPARSSHLICDLYLCTLTSKMLDTFSASSSLRLPNSGVYAR